jgi:dihydroorotase
MPLLVHAESTDPALDIFDREAAFLESEVGPLLAKMPELSVTVEHISTSTGIELVQQFDQAFGSITPHHLSCDRSDILANGLRPELYCKPVINSAEHREALVAAATSGSPKFFLGTDSAPHPLSQKETRVAKAGIFNAPYGLQVTAEVFHDAGALDQLAAFTSINGAVRYGKPVSEQQVRLERLAEPTEPQVAR